MAKSKQTFNKKEQERKRLQQRKEKKEKMEERKANAAKGKSLEDMMAYLDEDGNLTSVPPDQRKKKVVTLEEIQISTPKKQKEADEPRTGVITFFNRAKGFGFIADAQSAERIFFHVNNLLSDVNESDPVHFDIETGPRGLNAINVLKIA